MSRPGALQAPLHFKLCAKYVAKDHGVGWDVGLRVWRGFLTRLGEVIQQMSTVDLQYPWG
jgi:hypothetical protein